MEKLPEDLAHALPDVLDASSFRPGDELPTSPDIPPDIPGIHLKNVIGNDDRKRVTDTTRYPATSIAQLAITSRDGENFGATGVFVAPRTVLTAAHAVFIHSTNPDRHGPAARATVIPGRNGKDTLPFSFQRSNVYYVPRLWVERRLIAHDYALIFLENAPGVRPLLPIVLDDDQLKGRIAFISGYPLDKSVGTQWVHSRPIQDVNQAHLAYDIDTRTGQSGAPICMINDDDAFVVGIHRFGQSNVNFGLRITRQILDDLRPRFV